MSEKSDNLGGQEEENDGAARNRAWLERHCVFAVLIRGGTGCGKTSLIARTAAALMPETEVAVLAVDPLTRNDADRILPYTEQVLQINTKRGVPVRSADLYAALRKARILDVDLLMIEDVSSLIGDSQRVGQHATVGMFSVATGDDKPSKYPDVVRLSDLLLLNKIDLLADTRFDVGAFRGSVLAIKPNAAILPVSALTGEGLPVWIDWLKRQLGEYQKRWQSRRFGS